MSTPKDLDVADALENLVNQFADPLVFLRELIQNALDAGSPEVDVYTEFRPAEEGSAGEADDAVGMMVIGVDDYGEGMDREIIDNRLTRLFSSAKDQDFTKIGKFGIGFVSVFALAPDAVCVDTSRGGENWRILFKADRTFVRISREHPVDGTKIQVFKKTTRSTYEELSARARTTLSYWCKHVQGTVRFDDDDVAEPFERIPDALCQVTHEEEGIRVVVAYREGSRPYFGFYNRGLTLLEGQASTFIPTVAFKVDSKYLEHTLARDNIMRDTNFDKAMEVVERLADEPLQAQLYARIAELLRSRAKSSDLSALQAVAAGLVLRGHEPPSDSPVLALIDGSHATANTIERAAKDKRLWMANVRSPLVDAASEAGHTVVQLDAGAGGTRGLLQAIAGGPVLELRTSFIRFEPPPSAQAAEWEPLRAALAQLLTALKIKLAGVVIAPFDYPHSCIPDRVFVLVPGMQQLVPWTTDALRPMERWKKKDTLVINAAHPLVAPLHSLVQREQEFAAYTLLKVLNLAVGPLPVEVDARLATASTELRAKRLEAQPSATGGSGR